VDEVRQGAAELHGDDARHLTRVLRVEQGQQYEISDNRQAYLAEIVEARGDRVRFRVLEPIASRDLPVHITLLAALVKFDRFEWMIEKATEVGVDRIVPVEAGRSEKGLSEASVRRASRWVRVARESSQQARRVRSPEILPTASFRAALADTAVHRYFLEEETAPPLWRVLPQDRSPSDVAILVGPEGGWTGEEREKAAGAGWQAVSLGPQILRAETAALCAAAIVMNAWCV
jgi:16S rRNA (uracil1498-N3)-methyltransferase